MSESSAQANRATYSIREVSKLLGSGINQTYWSAESGELSKIAIKIGRRIFIPKEALHRMLAGDRPASAESKQSA